MNSNQKNRPLSIKELMQKVAHRIDSNKNKTLLTNNATLIENGKPITFQKFTKGIQRNPFCLVSDRVQSIYWNELKKKLLSLLQQLINYHPKKQQREKNAIDCIFKILQKYYKIQSKDIKAYKTKYEFPSKQGWYSNKIDLLLTLKFDKIPFFIRYATKKKETQAIYINPTLLIYLEHILDKNNSENK